MLNSNLKYNSIELREEDQALSFITTPNWILRWGIYLILFIIMLFIWGSIWFKYPDTISAEFTLTGITPPARVKSRTSGRMYKLYVKDKQKVHKGDYLAIIENTSDEKDIQWLNQYLKSFSIEHALDINFPKRRFKLGVLQNTYSSFTQILQNYKIFKENDYYFKKKKFINQELLYNKRRYEDISIQLATKKKQLIIMKRKYRRDSLLYFKHNAISAEDLENRYSNYLNIRISLLNTKVDLYNTKTTINRIESSIIDLDKDFIEKENNYIEHLNNLVQELMSGISNWEINYVLKAPIDGKVIFNNFWAENQNIIMGDEVFNILPNTKSNKPIAKVLLPTERSGKVKIGQRVNLHCKNFPDTEFGVIRGIVSNIALLPTSIGEYKVYSVEVTLPNGNVTSYQKKIPNYLDIEGRAEIITENMSLFERIINPIRKLLINNEYDM